MFFFFKFNKALLRHAAVHTGWTGQL